MLFRATPSSVLTVPISFPAVRRLELDMQCGLKKQGAHRKLLWLHTAKEATVSHMGNKSDCQSDFFSGFLSPSYSRCVHFSFQHLEISRRERLYPPCSGQNHRYSDTLNGKVRSFSAAAAPTTGSAPPHPLSHQAYEVGASIWSGASRRFRKCIHVLGLHSVCVIFKSLSSFHKNRWICKTVLWIIVWKE